MANPPDYRQILTDLYLRHNPEKVKDVDFLLKKFAGREEEMIAKIRQKYPEPTIPEQPEKKAEPIRKSPDPVDPASKSQPKVAPFPKPEPVKKPAEKAPQPTPKEKKIRRRSKRAFYIFALTIAIIGMGIGANRLIKNYTYSELVEDQAIAAEFDTLYVIADTVFARTGCDGMQTEKKMPLPFGRRILVRAEDNGSVECIPTMLGGKLLYVPKRYLGGQQEYLEINGLYGNKDARKLFDNSFEKRALLDEFKRRRWRSYLPQPHSGRFYPGDSGQTPVFRVFGDERQGMDHVAKGTFTPGWNDPEPRRPLDFAAIVEQVDERGKRTQDSLGRHLLIFRFNGAKEATLAGDLDLEEFESYRIRPVTYFRSDSWWGNYIRLDATPESGQIPVDALLLDRPGRKYPKYLLEFAGNGMRLVELRETIFGYAEEAVRYL